MANTKKYQSKDTALKNIKPGVNFTRAVFEDYWNDKDCFRLGVINNPYIIQHDSFDRDKFTSWWSTWRWEGSFVTELFLEIIKSKKWHQVMFPEGILEYLPELVTTDIQYALLAAGQGVDDYGLYMAKELQTNAAIEQLGYQLNNPASYSQPNDWVALNRLFADPYSAVQLFEVNGLVFEQAIPYEVRKKNSQVADTFERAVKNEKLIPQEFCNDIDSVIECLTPLATTAQMEDQLLERLRFVVPEKGVLEFLKARALANNLPTKPPNGVHKANKI
jgi:hypothetical protein